MLYVMKKIVIMHLDKVITNVFVSNVNKLKVILI